MDLLSRIASWLGENEATITALVGITVLAGIVFAGLCSSCGGSRRVLVNDTISAAAGMCHRKRVLPT